MEENIVFIDKALEMTFKEAYKVARIGCDDEDAAIKLGMCLDGVLSLTDEEGQANIIALKNYRIFFIKLMHAEVYAMTIASKITLDEIFCLEFDERITDGNYDDILTSYVVNLVKHYIEALKVKDDVVLSDDNMKLVREVFPLYRYL